MKDPLNAVIQELQGPDTEELERRRTLIEEDEARLKFQEETADA